MRAEIDPATGHVHAVLDAIGGDDRFENGLDASFSRHRPAAGGRDRARCRCRRRRRGATRPTSRSTGTARSCCTRRSRSTSTTATATSRAATVAESFGHVTNPYPREYLALAPDVATLEKAAAITGGTLNPEGPPCSTPARSRSRSTTSCGRGSSTRRSPVPPGPPGAPRAVLRPQEDREAPDFEARPGLTHARRGAALVAHLKDNR